MKIAIIVGSSRLTGNTATLAQHFSEHVPSEQNNADIFNLNDYKILPFDYEFNNKDDDFFALITQLLSFDCLIFATPVYWYSPSAQMKTFLDRLSDLLTCHKALGRKLREKSMALIATGYDENPPSCFEDIFRLSARYLGMNYKGMLYAACPESVDSTPTYNKQQLEHFASCFS